MSGPAPRGRPPPSLRSPTMRLPNPGSLRLGSPRLGSPRLGSRGRASTSRASRASRRRRPPPLRRQLPRSRRQDAGRSRAAAHSPDGWPRPPGTRVRLRTPARLRHARRRPCLRRSGTPPRRPWPRPALRQRQPRSRHLPPRQPRRPKAKPSASQRHARAGRRRVADGPRCRPGTRSCSVIRASGTSVTMRT